MEKQHWLIEKYGESIKIKKGTQLTKHGQVEKYLYLIQSGLIRMFVINDEGRECTFDFVSEGDFANAYQSFKLGEPSRIIIEAVTDCTLLRFDRKTLEMMLMSGTDEVMTYIKMLEDTFMKKLNWEIDLLSVNKYQLYLNLIDTRRELLQYVKIKDLASYLGISSHTMSRYRKKAHK